jgi:coniferyl-aldehyde dehydrogenase
MYPAGLDDPDYCSIINQRQYGRLVGYVEEARTSGAEVVPLFEGRMQDDERHRLGPAAVVDPGRGLAMMREEIFGPLLPLLPYDDVKEAIDFVNAQPSPLAMYWFDENRERTEWALKESHAGGMCVNETLMHIAQEELPFGGVGPSGMGHYHGEWGFETFSKLTPVFKQSRFNGMNLFMPPYKPHVQTILRLMKRF